MEQQDEVLPTEIPETQAPAEEEVLPTKSVKNFWERLDEVFNQNTELRQRMDELVEQFPEFQRAQGPFQSFIFQPSRISLSSNDDITPSQTETLNNPNYYPSAVNGHYPSEKFSSFRIRLKRPLRNVKSIQLLSGVIPNAVQNIPDNQTIFLYYKLRSVNNALIGPWTAGDTYVAGDIVTYLGLNYVLNTGETADAGSPPTTNSSYQTIQLPADLDRPNYYDLNTDHMNYIYLAASTGVPYDLVANGEQNLFNRTYEDYDDLVNALNFIMGQFQQCNNSQFDIGFSYDATLNKIIMELNPATLDSGFYYLPLGYEDPNIEKFYNEELIYGPAGELIALRQQAFLPGLTLNLRLGFTWNGVFTNPFSMSDPWSNLTFQSALYWYLRRKDPGYYPAPLVPDWQQDIITFNSYPDLVNTSCVRIYADFALASTQDSLGSSSTLNTVTPDGLLSLVPVNANNLGVAFYQNNFNNPLTKIPDNISEIGITMLNDQGQPYYLPNSATVLLELAIEYKS